jgi:hypothetical protein
MPKKNKVKFNYELVRNAEQFLTDLNNATIEKLNFQVENKKYYETPDWLQNRYNQAMQDLGRWIVKDYQEDREELYRDMHNTMEGFYQGN